MSHQPFETYLLNDALLTDAQQHSLDLHLKDCEQCTALSHALVGLDTILLQNPSPMPAPGFTQRWQLRLATHQQSRQNRYFWLMALSMLALAGLTMFIILIFNFSHINWSYELTQAIARVSIFAGQVRQLLQLSRTFVYVLPVLVPVIALAAYGTIVALCVIFLTWFKTMTILYSPIHKRGNLR